MKISPTQIKPTELVRILNSAGFGQVITDNVLHRHRNSTGYTIGDGKTVDLLRYTAWLMQHYLTPAAPSQSYEERKEAQRQSAAELARAGQDIGDIPPVVNPERRQHAMSSFRFFCERYFPDVFYLSWSDDHLKVIDKIEKAVLQGGLFALAMPRGSGKTVMMQMACLWSALIRATPFVCLIAASADRAQHLLENIKVWLETNELLAEDFPEVTFPIRALERIINRQRGQRHNGIATRIEWLNDKIVLPTIEGSCASGVVISCSGMKGSDICGQNHARPDGKVVRP